MNIFFALSFALIQEKDILLHQQVQKNVVRQHFSALAGE